ncbi:MAG: AAA family ATPase [Bacteroidales bacterium]|nr:AAA family ATPase [Bacteroidales bacterium]
MESTQQIDLDNYEFGHVLTLINHTDRSVFMTGKAGTGKSTFLRYITENTHKKHVVLAPTGIAAVNAGGQTLHSFFHIPLKPLLPDDPEFAPARLRNRMKYSKRFVKLLRELELIIIDEISMVRADTIDFIDRLLRYFCGNNRRPFAGKQILMVGDIFQLEPVVTSDAREILRRAYPNFFFFSARVFEDFHLVPIELRKVYRQSDSTFIAMLDRVRAGHPTRYDLAAVNARVGIPVSGDDSGTLAMTIATRRDIVDHINEEHLDNLSTPSFTFEAEISGDFPDSSFPTDRLLTLKEGAQVVFIRNDPERRWVNGTLGRVSFITAEELRITLENGDTHTIDPEIWDNVEYGFDEEERTVTETVKGSFRQYPVKLAWALTIHKSQGLTFSRVNIDVGRGAFTGGQTYVALSRCTSLDGITLATPMRDSDIYVNPFVLKFARSFNDAGLMTEALAAARADECYARAAAEFENAGYGAAFDSFVEAVRARDELSNPLLRKLVIRKLHSLNALNATVDRQQREIERQAALLAEIAAEFVTLGRTCLDEGWEVSAAIANFDKALRLCPDCYEALIAKGEALMIDGDTENALDILLRAGELNDRYEAPYLLGSLFLSTGDTSNAINCLQKAQKADPAQPTVHDLLADAFEVSGDDIQAQRHRRQAEKLRNAKKRRK